MSSTFDFVCCLPVLLLWLGPLALAVFCLGFGGCIKLAQRLRRKQLTP